MGFAEDSNDPAGCGQCKCIQETPNAILVDRNGGQAWVPKSQIHDASQVKKLGQMGTLIINKWLAQKKGWI